MAVLGCLVSGCTDVGAASGKASALVSSNDPVSIEITKNSVGSPLQSARAAAQSASEGQARPSPCPEGMAAIETFCIDRYEDVLVTRGPSGESVMHPYFERPAEGASYEARSERGVYPQGYVSRRESHDACANVDKRLCTMHEWQRACEGSHRTNYPYGDHWEPKHCNMDKPHLLSLRFGWDARRWHYEDFNDPSLNQEPGFLTKTGELEQCVSDTQVYDLVGNLHEWVSDDVDGAFVARLESEGVSRAYQPWSAGNGVFMGGFFSTHEQHGPGCKFTTIAHEPGYHDYSTGFRCCKDAG